MSTAELNLIIKFRRNKWNETENGMAKWKDGGKAREEKKIGKIPSRQKKNEDGLV